MSDTQQLPLSVQPVISYPREAQVGKTYLMTIDLQPSGDEWLYEEEEYSIYCMLDTSPLFSSKPVGEPAIVLHRFGGSYGAAKFLLTAAQEEMEGEIRVTLVNAWGVPIRVLSLDNLKVICNSGSRNRCSSSRPMDQNRLKAYSNLLQLMCSGSAEVADIFNANRELFDSGLVWLMEFEAQRQAEQGNEQFSLFFKNIAAQLASAIGYSPPAVTPQESLIFLAEVLTETQLSQGDPKVVYPLLEANLGKLNEENFGLGIALILLGFREESSVRLQQTAAALVFLCQLILDFPLGSRASNLEMAIIGNHNALNVFTREAFPEQWAETQNNLGMAYSDRIRGERAENLEQAIACYENALQVYTREASPEEWAAIQNNLATAYHNRILGKRAENLEQAIADYENVLQVYTREAFPEQWARTQNNLATAYNDRIGGQRAENLEQAIACYKNALQVFTREAFPEQWAMTQHNLGAAYNNRILNDRAENLEQAIACYKKALQVRTREAFPEDWADTQNNLGAVYNDRVRGEQVENLEQAIACFENALQVYSQEAFPKKWAVTQMNLAVAYGNRTCGDLAENLEQAIVYSENALQVYTQTAFPLDWAKTQHNLGTAYSNRIRGEQAENLELAIVCYENALQVCTREAFPQKNAQTLFNLGLAYQTFNELHLAHNAFEAALETVELLRSEVRSGDVIKQKLAEEWNGLDQRIVEVCLEMSRYSEAIEYVERSKTRNLVELILRRDLHNLFPPRVARQLQQLEDEIAIVQDKLQNHKSDYPTALAQHLMQLRQQRNELQNRYLPVGSGFRFDQFQAILDDRTALIEWYITDDKILAFIIQPHPSQGQEISVWQSRADDRKALIDWTNAYLEDYGQQNDNWRTQLRLRLEELSKILHLDEILAQLRKEYNQLILIPHQLLHLFPLHALPVMGKSCLLDHFPRGVRYAPSCQLLRLVQSRKRPYFTHFFAVQNPTADMTYTDMEVEAIKDFFEKASVLKQSTATKAAIKEAPINAIHCLHFNGHSYFNFTNPWESRLILADAPVEPVKQHHAGLPNGEVHDLENYFTLAEIYSLNLEQCRLVTLSACETGLIDFTNPSDEYIGFPGAFLCAGSASVVSPLWSINDLSTALLMIKFYQNLKSGSTVALALNTAQIWLRDVTVAELQTWASHLKLDKNLTQQIEQSLDWFDSNEKPFQEPYYWAAFCAIGQ
jgi:CHAT domain-containing protein